MFRSTLQAIVIGTSTEFAVVRAGYAFAGSGVTGCNVPTRTGIAAFVVTARCTGSGDSVISSSQMAIITPARSTACQNAVVGCFG